MAFISSRALECKRWGLTCLQRLNSKRSVCRERASCYLFTANLSRRCDKDAFHISLCIPVVLQEESRAYLRLLSEAIAAESPGPFQAGLRSLPPHDAPRFRAACPWLLVGTGWWRHHSDPFPQQKPAWCPIACCLSCWPFPGSHEPKSHSGLIWMHCVT